MVDNASSDDTPRFFREWTGNQLRYIRNAANVGLIQALNQGTRAASGDRLCFLHNDAEMREPRWLERLEAAVDGPGRIGLAGLYGVRRLRRDGRYVGRTIVHALAGHATIRQPVVEVAAVDGVCLFVPRAILEGVGGFDEGYGFYHGHDRDLSLAVLERGRRCLVVHAPFRHHGGRTRTRDFTRDPDEARRDRALRNSAMVRFSQKYRRILPCDVRSRRERVRDWLGIGSA